MVREIIEEMDPIEAEVDAIRHKIWLETKDMTDDERRDYLIRRTDPIIKQFHMKLVKGPLPPNEPIYD